MNQHDEHAPVLPPHDAPWWEDGHTISSGLREPTFLVRGIMAFWQRLRSWLLLPLAELDPLTCSRELLDLLAWERDIQQFAGEPLALFRKRVKYAFINAKDAGEVAGFKRIFERLGIGWCDIHERRAGEPWDVITIEVSDSALTENQPLMQALIQHYGRTCRRYQFQVVYPVRSTLHTGRIDMCHSSHGASLKTRTL